MHNMLQDFDKGHPEIFYSESFSVKKIRQIRLSSKMEDRNDKWNREIGLWKSKTNLYIRLAMWQEKKRTNKHESDVNIKNCNQRTA